MFNQDYLIVFSQNYSGLGLLALIVFAIIFLLVSVLRYLARTADERTMRRILKSISIEYIKDVTIPDGVDGYAFIDYLALLPKGILVISTYYYKGVIFGGEKIDEWTQMIGSKSYKFKNPLQLNSGLTQFIENLVFNAAVNVPINGQVIFASSGTFPKGLPANVSTTKTFQFDITKFCLESDKQFVEPELLATWQRINQSINNAKLDLTQDKVSVMSSQ